MFKVKALLATGLVLLSAVSFAQNKPAWQQKIIAHTFFGYGSSSLDSASGIDHKRINGFTYNIGVGYQFTPHWGTLIEFTKFKRYLVGAASNKLDVYLMGLSLQYSHPLCRKLWGSVKVGAGGQRRVGSTTSSGASKEYFAATGGLGLQYHVLPNLYVAAALNGSYGKLKTYSAVGGFVFLIPV